MKQDPHAAKAPDLTKSARINKGRPGSPVAASQGGGVDVLTYTGAVQHASGRQTETGTWSFNATEADGSSIIASIGFPIKLAVRLEGAEVHFQPPSSAEESVKNAFAAVCPTGVINPTAVSGHLCVYYNEFEPEALFNVTSTEIDLPYLFGEPGASVVGGVLRFALRRRGRGNSPWLRRLGGDRVADKRDRAQAASLLSRSASNRTEKES
jgi:hypothetical protein